jgi:hypothetical protein
MVEVIITACPITEELVTELKWHAISIDQPFGASNILTTAPQHIKDYTDRNRHFAWYERVLDLPVGTHTLYYAHSGTQPAHLYVHINDALKAALTKTSPNTLYSVSFDVTERTLYDIGVRQIEDGTAYAASWWTRDCLPQDTRLWDYAYNNLYPYPFRADPRQYTGCMLFTQNVLHYGLTPGNRNYVAFKSLSGLAEIHQIPPSLFNAYLLGFPQPIGIEIIMPPDCIMATYNKFGADNPGGLPSGIRALTNYPVVNTSKLTDLVYTNSLGIVRRGVTPENFTDADYIETDNGSLILAAGSPAEPPPTYLGTYTVGVDAIPLHPSNPTEDNLEYATIRIYPNGIVIPYVRIKELPPSVNLKTIWANSNVATEYDIPILFKLNSKIVSQGYFTLEYGRWNKDTLTPIPGTPFALPRMEKLGEIKVPLRSYARSATVNSLTLKATPPARLATVNSLTLKAIPPAKLATVNSLTLKETYPPKMATVNNLSLKTISPPPPPAGYTFSGKVLSILGPVAEAEVSLNGLTAKTAGDGSFTITDIPEGTYTLTVKPTRIHEKILLKSVTQKIGIYMNTSKTIMLPLNLTNLAIGAGATVAVGAVVAATRKPKPPTW